MRQRPQLVPGQLPVRWGGGLHVRVHLVWVFLPTSTGGGLRWWATWQPRGRLSGALQHSHACVIDAKRAAQQACPSAMGHPAARMTAISHHRLCCLPQVSLGDVARGGGAVVAQELPVVRAYLLACRPRRAVLLPLSGQAAHQLKLRYACK